MGIVSDWDWGTFVPPGLGVTHIFHLSDPTEARKRWLLSQVGENPQPQAPNQCSTEEPKKEAE